MILLPPNFFVTVLSVDPFQASVVFHIEISHLLHRAKLMVGFHVERNIGQ